MSRLLLFLLITIITTTTTLRSQDLLLIDRGEEDRIVNDSVITVYSTDTSIIDLTKYFIMVNNTDSTLSLFLRKKVHTVADSTIDYFCFGPRCWPETDTTDIPAILEPGVENNTFASHVVHERRFEMPPLPPGLTSITYTIFDNTTFSEPVEAKVTVNYHLSPVSIFENKRNAISVFPNPAKDKIFINPDELISEPSRIILTNINGEVVIDKIINPDNGIFQLQLESIETNGIFFGRILNKKHNPSFFKILIRK